MCIYYILEQIRRCGDTRFAHLDSTTFSVYGQDNTASEPQKEATPIEIEKGNPWDESTINTVESATYLSEIEKQIVIGLNKVRTKPKKHSELYLEPMRNLFRGNILQYPGEIAIRTKESVSALNECISVLNKTKPMGVLNITEGINLAAIRTH